MIVVSKLDGFILPCWSVDRSGITSHATKQSNTFVAHRFRFVCPKCAVCGDQHIALVSVLVKKGDMLLQMLSIDFGIIETVLWMAANYIRAGKHAYPKIGEVSFWWRPDSDKKCTYYTLEPPTLGRLHGVRTCQSLLQETVDCDSKSYMPASQTVPCHIM